MIECQGLLPIQELDLQIDEKENTKNGLLNELDGLRKKLDEDSLLLNKKKALLKKIILRNRENEGNSADLNDQIKTINLKMKASGVSPSSYKALQREIDLLNEKLSKIETLILQDLEKIELLEKDIKKSEVKINYEDDELSKKQIEIKQAIAALNGEIDTIRTDRNQQSLKIDTNILQMYEELRKKKRRRVIHETDVPNCPGCGMGLSGGFVNKIASHNGAEPCNYCGNLLIWNGYRE